MCVCACVCSPPTAGSTLHRRLVAITALRRNECVSVRVCAAHRQQGPPYTGAWWPWGGLQLPMASSKPPGRPLRLPGSGWSSCPSAPSKETSPPCGTMLPEFPALRCAHADLPDWACACVCVCVCVCGLSVCLFVCLCLHMYVCIYASVHICVCVHVCACALSCKRHA